MSLFSIVYNTSTIITFLIIITLLSLWKNTKEDVENLLKNGIHTANKGIDVVKNGLDYTIEKIQYEREKLNQKKKELY